MVPWPCMSFRGQVIIKNPLEKNSIFGICQYLVFEKISAYIVEHPLWEKFSEKCQNYVAKVN